MLEPLEDRVTPSGLAPAAGSSIDPLQIARSAHVSQVAAPPVRAAQDVGQGLESRSPLPGNRPVLPRGADPARASFIDPTARIVGARQISIGERVYIGPFVTLIARRGGTITIGDGANIQDNATIVADGPDADVVLGDLADVAHNATVIGPARIGTDPDVPAFVAFNAVVDRATVESGAFVQSLARLAPGIVLHAGRSLQPGRFAQTQAEADDFSLGKVRPVVPENMQFLRNDILVNTIFAREYAALASSSPLSVRGISIDPPNLQLNPDSGPPTLAGRARTVPRFRDRIIGDVWLADSLGGLNRVLGRGVSIRADEGTPFRLGHIVRLGDRVTIHALGDSPIAVGDGVRIGSNTVLHGRPEAPGRLTLLGNNIRVGSNSVVFRSVVGDDSVIGDFVYLDNSQLPPGSVVPRGTILRDNQVEGLVEWI
jgi:carbonic anhydrase/acetyltransferase-like protein (isoleucine patch superfamily)